MGIGNILSLLGGLALFLYGMQMMSDGLEAAAGNRMKQILEKLTSNRILGVLVGAGITAIIQSSSATTVMVVGFVNSGMMTLRQAVWIIMGANIGTTITGHLIALDVGALAPLFAFCGVVLIIFLKKPVFHHYGLILSGFGVLFIGMDMMSAAMMPLRESEAFISLMTRFSNPILGILAGAVFTAIIQSSSASVGILQALAASGLITLPSAVFVLFGQNIGTCITAVLASIGTSRSAKRTTVIHLLFNVIGTTIFTVLCLVLPVAVWVEGLNPGNVPSQIATMHTIFNVTTTLILLPMGTCLAGLAVRILPERPEEEEKHRLLYLKDIDLSAEYHMGNSAIMINGIQKELERMSGMVRENMVRSFDLMLRTGGSQEDVQETEAYIDYLNHGISRYISHVIMHETNEWDSARISAFFKVSGDLERIADHAVNICDNVTAVEEKGAAFSEYAREEIRRMQATALRAMDLVSELGTMPAERLEEMVVLEQQFDDMTREYRRNQIERMQSGICSNEASILYSEILTDFERVGDHMLNIGRELAGS